MLRIYLPSSTDLKLCSDVPTVDFVNKWTFVTIFTSRYLGSNIWVLTIVGWKCEDESAKMKVRGWKCEDESVRMKVRGWKCWGWKIRGWKSQRMKNQGWKWKDEISEDEVSRSQKLAIDHLYEIELFHWRNYQEPKFAKRTSHLKQFLNWSVQNHWKNSYKNIMLQQNPAFWSN